MLAMDKTMENVSRRSWSECMRVADEAIKHLSTCDDVDKSLELAATADAALKEADGILAAATGTLEHLQILNTEQRDVADTSRR